MESGDMGIPTTGIATATKSSSRQIGIKWGDLIDDDRRRKLEGYEQGARPEGYGPYAVPGEPLTGADVFWLAACALVERERITPDEAMNRLDQAKKDSLLRVSLNLSNLDLRGARLSGAHLEGAVLGHAQFQGATMGAVNLRGAYLGEATLDDAFLDRADMTGANLRGASLKRVSLRWATLDTAYLEDALLHDTILQSASLVDARLIKAQLIRVDAREATLDGANFIRASLEDVYFYEASLARALFTDAKLTRCDFRRATLDSQTRLNKATLNTPSLEQTRLNDTNLAVVDWADIKQLGDEIEARESKKRVYVYGGETYRDRNERRKGEGAPEAIPERVRQGVRIRKFGERKSQKQRADDYLAAARAYRALSVALNNQGLSRDAARF
ncbi:MAG TPA: pentapeptide repeat-containing protein, partial [Ktedonobacterales bacterium]|nr:pentapeptide repeat-containing protein [Ktedonobacterales bacterium]